jgi:hypothetical protein
MIKWETDNKGKVNKEEKFLRRMVRKLNRYTKRHGIRYAEVYVIESDGTRTVNIRAKRDAIVIVNSYAFV